MSYATEKVKVGRDAVVVAVLKVDRCTQSYGVAPCAAAIGVTGTQRCFNTCKTCQDLTHYAPVPKSYAFSNRPIAPRARSIALAIGGQTGKYSTSYDALTFPNIALGDTWALDGIPLDRIRARIVPTYVIT